MTSESNLNEDEGSHSKYEESHLAKMKSKGFKKTSPQSEAETILKCAICNKTFKIKLG